MNKLIICFFCLSLLIYANNDMAKLQNELDSIENNIKKEDKDLDKISEDLLDNRISKKNIEIIIDNKLDNNYKIKKINTYIENKLISSSDKIYKQLKISKKLIHKNFYSVKIEIHLNKNNKNIIKEFKDKTNFIKTLILNISNDNNLVKINKEDKK